ncbi:hypothetical protein [Nitratireductor pacificus]|uniref:Mn2+-dependent serine/threonine protein kinase n=1 Tax=Nitratireductor pacificus pht-3B TaxID=391937 RepID=K2MPL9_9HYPH|nr:hypothetical protein [Nitratireductor pacificus]EKF19257.1 Mn2+-dependent serine/threonine protein kinase [Nitratireductor pacificus pht-3B]
MNDETKSEGGLLSPKATEALLRLLVGGARERVSSALIDGRTVWIKRHDVGRQRLARWLHEAVSPLVPAMFLRASPRVDAAGAVDREVRKTEAFHAAGFPTAKLLFRNDRVLVLSNVAPIVQGELDRLAREGADAVHDGLLVDAATALRSAHRLGLCHGRPHLRDMFITGDGAWGFVDFEEEPEAAMPLDVAQARDVWLLFLQVCMQARRPGTPQAAFDAYFTDPSPRVADELRRIIRFSAPLIPLLGAIEHRGLGSDGRRVLKATRFLKAALEGAASTPVSDSLAEYESRKGL